MTKNEIKLHTKELYESVILVFKDEATVDFALDENLFDDNYMKVFVLLLSYFKLADVPNRVLEVCLDCKEIPQQTYNIFFQYCQDKWMYKACGEITDVIKEIEEGKF